jgi:hypothetical protein
LRALHLELFTKPSFQLLFSVIPVETGIQYFH